MCHGSPVAGGGSSGLQVGFGVRLCRGAKSKEPPGFILSTPKRDLDLAAEDSQVTIFDTVSHGNSWRLSAVLKIRAGARQLVRSME